MAQQQHCSMNLIKTGKLVEIQTNNIRDTMCIIWSTICPEY